MIEHRIAPGLTHVYTKEASSNDGNPAMAAGGIMEYLVSTPAIFKMIIDASSQLLDPMLPAEFITVGKNIELLHEKPSMVNGMITIKLLVTKVEGDHIYLEFTGHDSFGEICKGKYERVIVNQQQLMEFAYKRAGTDLIL